MAFLDSSGLSHFLDKLKSYFLPVSGGTMSGAIEFDSNDVMLCQATRTKRLVLTGGDNSAAAAGAKITLNGGDRATEAGQFVIQAGTGTTWAQLVGTPAGTLSWGGSGVVTAASLAPVEIALTDAEYCTFTTLKAWRSGNVVNVSLYFKMPSTAPSTWTEIASGLPAPMDPLKTMANTWTGSYARPAAIAVESDGKLRVNFGKAATSYVLVFSYITSE